MVAAALLKRYVCEDGSDELRHAMAQHDRWTLCRVGSVEALRAVALVGARAGGEAVGSGTYGL